VQHRCVPNDEFLEDPFVKKFLIVALVLLAGCDTVYQASYNRAWCHKLIAGVKTAGDSTLVKQSHPLSDGPPCGVYLEADAKAWDEVNK